MPVSDIAKALKFDDEEQFLAKVGFGDIQSRQISGAIALMEKNLHPDDELRPLLLQAPPKKQGLTINGVSGLHTRMEMLPAHPARADHRLYHPRPGRHHPPRRLRRGAKHYRTRAADHRGVGR